MAGSLNKATIIGHLGSDPEVRSLASGAKVVNFSVATSETWRDKASGEKKERTEWHRVVIWSEGLAKVAETYLKKGSKVYLEGQLQTRKWKDQSGADKYTTEIVLNGFGASLIMLDGRDTSGDGRAGGGVGGTSSGSAGSGAASRPGGDRPGQGAAGEGSGGIDDDIPFAMEWRG